MSLLASHPYLASNILNVCLVLAAAWFLLRPPERATALWMGLINTASTPFSAFLEGAYWAPARLGGFSFGVEDVLCTFHLGAVVWLTALLAGRGRIVLPVSPRPRLRRFAGVTAVAMSSFLALWRMGVPPMTGLILTQVVLLVLLVAVSRSCLRLAVLTAVVYPILYLAVVNLYFRIWPSLGASWLPLSPWGPRVLGVPLGELAWVLEFSFCWPLYACYVFDVRLEGRHA